MNTRDRINNEWLFDELTIRDVVHRYCRAVDRADWDLLRTCYHDDAVEKHGRYNGDIEGFVSWLKLIAVDFESSMHHIGNILVEFVQPNLAWVESYCVAYHRSSPIDGDMPFDRTVWVRYVDIFECRDNRWAIVHRTCLFDFVRTDVVPANSELDPAHISGRRGIDDPSYRELNRLSQRHGNGQSSFPLPS